MNLLESAQYTYIDQLVAYQVAGGYHLGFNPQQESESPFKQYWSFETTSHS
jgi:hypothetical protein